MTTTGSYIGKTYVNPAIVLAVREFSTKENIVTEGNIFSLKLEKHLKDGCYLVDYKDCTFKVLEYKNRGFNGHYRILVTPRTMQYKRFLTYSWTTITTPEPFIITIAEHRMFGLVSEEKYQAFYIPIKREVSGWEGYNFDIDLSTGKVTKNDKATAWLK